MNAPIVLLYGATGYSGGLIIEEALHQREVARRATGKARANMTNYRLVLGAYDRRRLSELAGKHGFEYRVFALDNQTAIEKGLEDVAVVVNAAGPFAWTAERLATTALKFQRHYVDINGEFDVYQRLDDLASKAKHAKRALVCGAGFTPAVSELLLDYALSEVGKKIEDGALGAIRIAMSRVRDFSRGSAQTAWRSIREQVAVVRGTETRGRRLMKITHQPVGKLERTFDFGNGARGAGPSRDLRIASATDLVDTLTARRTAERREVHAKAIESYVDMGTAGRVAYQAGALIAPFAAIPLVRALANFQIDQLPSGPAAGERDAQRHVVVLEIEDRYRAKLVDWRLETPNSYQLTAQLALAIAARLTTPPPDSKETWSGWLTASQVLESSMLAAPGNVGPFRGCELFKRSA